MFCSRLARKRLYLREQLATSNLLFIHDLSPELHDSSLPFPYLHVFCIDSCILGYHCYAVCADIDAVNLDRILSVRYFLLCVELLLASDVHDIYCHLLVVPDVYIIGELNPKISLLYEIVLVNARHEAERYYCR